VLNSRPPNNVSQRAAPDDGLGAKPEAADFNMGFRSAPKADFDLTRERLANVKDSRAGNFAPS